MNNKITKMISAVLAVLLILINSMTLISYAADTFMSENALENQEKTTNISNVGFDVKYENGKHTETLDATEAGTLNIEISVKNSGYLKNPIVSFEGANFSIQEDNLNTELVQNFDEKHNQIVFNQINSGSSINKSLIIQMDAKNTFGSDIASRDNEVKLQAIYVDSNGKETEVEGKVVIHTDWKLDTAEIEMEQQITKYTYYGNKLIIQSKINENLVENILPVKEVNLKVDLPSINGNKPSYVSVISNSTKATNGNKNNATFNYDEIENVVSIKVLNDEIDGKIEWNKNSTDEFLVTYMYEMSEDEINNLKSSTVSLSYRTTAEIKTYSSNNLKLDKVIEGYEDANTEIGTIADIETTTTEKVNKGYLYNNITTADENKRETEYTVNYKATIPVSTLVENIIFEEEISAFTKEDTIVTGAVSYDKTIRISSKEFIDILGEDGSIQILNQAGEVLTTITNDSPVTNGYFVIDIAALNIEKIKVITSKPQTDGILNVKVDKAIRKDLTYSKLTLEEVTSLLNRTNLKLNSSSEEILIGTTENYINFEEPTQKVNVEINKETLSTVITNEGVEIRVTLENDTIDDKMFDSPKVDVTLPSNINDISVKAQLYYDDELSIASANLKNNQDGTKTITLQLNGTQTKYNNVAAKGATIVITADIDLEELTPTTQHQIVATATNNDGTVTENTCNVKYVAPTGLVATNGVTYQNETTMSVMSLSGDENVGLIKNSSSEQEVTFNMNVINNYENTISNVVVLGRIPAKGNGTETNLDLTLTSKVPLSHIDNAIVYYSPNVSATTDLNNSANAWTTDENSIPNSKSYMIVLPDTELEQGKGFKFSYYALVPGDLDYDKYSYENYSVYYTNNQSDGAISEMTKSATTGITTGTGPKFEASITQNTEATIKSGSIIKYTLIVNNEGTEQADGVTATLPILKDMTLVQEDITGGLEYIISSNVTYTNDETDTNKKYAEFELGSIAASSSIEQEIWIKTTAVDTEEISFSTQVVVKNEKAETTTNTVQSNLTKSYFTGTISGTTGELRENEETTLILNIKSAKEYENNVYYKMNETTGEMELVEVQYDGERKNTILKLELPEELTITNITKGTDDLTSSLTVNNNIANVNIGTISHENVKLEVTVKGNIKETGIYNKKVSVKVKLKADNTEEEEIGIAELSINKLGVSITQTSNIPSSVEIGTSETYKYTFTVENLSNVLMSNLTFTDKIPNGLIYSYTKVILADGTEKTYTQKDEQGNATATVLLLGGKEKATIEVNVIADITEQGLTVINKGSISQSEIETVESNEVTNKITAYKPGDLIGDKPSPGVPTNKKTGRIAGVIWFDENKDGIKDVNETKISGVKVLLLDNNTGNITKSSNNENAITETDTDGAYAFSNIYEGSYTVIFLYDSKNYTPTSYQKEGVDSSMNSDAMDKTVIYEGQTMIAAVTEEIKLTADNQYDIDLGLIEEKKFDLRLDKTVTSITVTDKDGTKVHEYNKDFAKIDFKSKYADSSTMVVEYKLVVTNEGAIPGYVKKVADYLPTELTFNSELNTDWYASTDGKTVYNNSMANILLNPGESIEIKLVLTKAMTSNSIGLTITNNAEIYETSNDYGLEDIDSKPGNKEQSEDDYSSANVLTSVQTGQTVIYITLGLVIIMIVGAGAYIIKKKVIK